MRIRDTMLLTSWPLRWSEDAPWKQVSDELGKILDRSLPGIAALGVETGRESTDWIDPIDSQATLADILERAAGPTSPTTDATWIFADVARLRAVTGIPWQGSTDERWMATALQLKWVSGPAGVRILLSQLRVFDRWPVSPRFAPPCPTDGAMETECELDQGIAHILGPATAVANQTRALLERAGLQAFRAPYGDIQFEPPVLYYVAPCEVPQSPEAYLAVPSLPFVKRATKCLLGVDDPLSGRVGAGFVEGNILLLRSQRLEAGDQSPAQLLLPCLLPGEDWEDVEADLAFIADEWTLEEFRAAHRVFERGFFRQARDSLRSVDALEAALSRVPLLMVEVRSLVARPGPARDTTEPAFRITERLNALLSRLRYELFTRTEPALHIGAELNAEIAASREQFESLFTVRDIPGRATLLGQIEHLPSVKATRRTSLALQGRAERLRTALDAYRETLSAVLEQQRQEQRDRTERAQTVVGIAVAALAGVTAMPLIVGQFDPGSLQAALGRLPGPLSGLEDALYAATPWIGAGSIAGALGLMGFLGFALWRPSRAKRSVEDDGVAIAGKVLGQLSRETTGIGPVAETDRRVCEALIEALESLRRLERRAADGDLEAAVEALIVRAEIGARRPVPLRLPMAAALIRYGLEPAAPGTWLGSDEMAETLEMAGWPATSIERLEELDAYLDPQQLVATLEGIRTTTQSR